MHGVTMKMKDRKVPVPNWVHTTVPVGSATEQIINAPFSYFIQAKEIISSVNRIRTSLSLRLTFLTSKQQSGFHICYLHHASIGHLMFK